jgi:ankyrin repeat protein
MENLTLGALKPPAKTQAEQYKYNKVLIIGENLKYDLKVLKENNPSILFIGDGVDVLKEKYISQTLQENKTEIHPQATYCVGIHGYSKRIDKGVYEPHNHESEENTQKIFNIIGDFSQSLLPAAPAQGYLTKIILNSCQAGAAQHLNTPKNSLIFARGSRRYITYSTSDRVISYLDTLHKSIEQFAIDLCEGGETCYLIKDKEVQKVRRPKIQEEYQNPQEHFQVQWDNFRKILPELPEILPKDFDKEKINKALSNALLINTNRKKKEQIEYALKSGFDINAVNEYGTTALQLASNREDIETVQFLLENGANVKAVNGNNETALHIASHKRYHDICNALLNVIPEKERYELISIKNNKGYTALHLASHNNHRGIVKVLLNGIPEKERYELISIKNNKGYTALHFASEKGYHEIVRGLLNEMSGEQKYALTNIESNGGWTALHSASEKGNHWVIRALLNGMSEKQRDALIKKQSKNGNSALHIASQFKSYNCHYWVVHALLEKISPEQRDTFINQQNNKGCTALHLASHHGQDKIVRELLKMMSEEQRDAFINQQDNEGYTALHFASQRGHTEIVKLLLENGANTEIKTKLGNTPLAFAQDNKNEEMIQLLLENAKTEA